MQRDLQFRNEMTPEIRENAIDLLSRVNALLLEMLVMRPVVTSGWRPRGINKNTKNAATKSNHMSGKAIDLLDDAEQTLANRIMQNPEILDKFELWMEHPEHTRGKWTNWVHLDTGTRTAREVRVFRPFA